MMMMMMMCGGGGGQRHRGNAGRWTVDGCGCVAHGCGRVGGRIAGLLCWWRFDQAMFHYTHLGRSECECESGCEISLGGVGTKTKSEIANRNALGAHKSAGTWLSFWVSIKSRCRRRRAHTRTMRNQSMCHRARSTHSTVGTTHTHTHSTRLDFNATRASGRARARTRGAGKKSIRYTGWLWCSAYSIYAAGVWAIDNSQTWRRCGS